MSDSVAWQSLTSHMGEVMRLSQIHGLLAWDQQVNLPAEGHADRGAQVALLSGLIQERSTDARVGGWLSALEGEDLDAVRKAGVRNHRRSFDRNVKLPAGLAERQALAATEGYGAWHNARIEGDYALFAPHLERCVALARERADALDPKSHPYDVLLEDYDPGVRLADLKVMFGRLREGLVELIGAVDQTAPQMRRDFEIGAQRELHAMVAEKMGYPSGDAGRIDDAVHPFTATMGGRDVRITTRFTGDDLLGGLGATMHEAGHALYELGIPRSPLGTGIDGPASLGVHESQSRFWENYIGGSRPFLNWFAGRLQERFGDDAPDGETLFRSANRIAPSKIRIYADEVTYNLHIIVRWQLEVALLEGSLSVQDLPDAWNAAYKEVLGLDIDNNVEGVMQDVHWGSGTIGYFPSYTLGNLYAAGLGGAMQRDLPDLWEQVGRAELGQILEWLRENVHRHGHVYDGPELIERVTGKLDLVDNLLSYLWGRHGALHGVSRG